MNNGLMKDNYISSNSISGVSLERRENKVFGEEVDHQSQRAYYKGREQRGIHI